MPKKKELRFFDKDKNFKKGNSYYESTFDNCLEHKEIGEVSPPYWYKGITFDNDDNYQFNQSDDVPIRIKKSYPNIKLIFTLRNPVDRIYSQFWKNVRQGREDKSSVVEAVKDEIKGVRSPIDDERCWLYKNSYYTHFKKWDSLFSSENIRVLIFEEWIENVDESLVDIFDFLDVNPEFRVEDKSVKKNESRVPRSRFLRDVRVEYLGETILGKSIRWLNQYEGRPKPSEDERQWLFEVLENEIKQMEELLGRSLSIWRPENYR